MASKLQILETTRYNCVYDLDISHPLNRDTPTQSNKIKIGVAEECKV